MNFQYTKVTQNQEGQKFERWASVNMDVIWHVEDIEGVLLCHTTLSPIQINRPRPRYNNKGQVNGVQYMKETEHPVIKIVKEEDIKRFWEIWDRK